MIVSFNFDYALPGQEDAVLKQRLRACDVRNDMGVPRGRVLARGAYQHLGLDVPGTIPAQLSFPDEPESDGE